MLNFGGVTKPLQMPKINQFHWAYFTDINGITTLTHTIRVWLSYLHFGWFYVDLYGKCRQIYHTCTLTSHHDHRAMSGFSPSRPVPGLEKRWSRKRAGQHNRSQSGVRGEKWRKQKPTRCSCICFSKFMYRIYRWRFQSFFLTFSTCSSQILGEDDPNFTSIGLRFHQLETISHLEPKGMSTSIVPKNTMVEVEVVPKFPAFESLCFFFQILALPFTSRKIYIYKSPNWTPAAQRSQREWFRVFDKKSSQWRTRSLYFAWIRRGFCFHVKTWQNLWVFRPLYINSRFKFVWVLLFM